MNRSIINFRLCFKQLDQENLEQFLMTHKDELYLPDRQSVQKIIDLVFEKGGVIAGFDEANQIQAMFGFFIGDPDEEFVHKDMFFIYVAAISKSFRLSRTFLKGLNSIIFEGKRLKIDRFRMQAAIHDRYLNRLYSKISTHIGQSKTLRGHLVNVYGGTVNDLYSLIGPNLQAELIR